MRILILGSAAGGGFPQWNCGCGNCTALRCGTFSGHARSQAQLAISSDECHWFLAGASPDLRSQIEHSPDLYPRALRDSPIAGVILGSADLDHVIGLLLLRELQPMRVYGTGPVLRILRENNSMFGMLNRVEPQAVWTTFDGGQFSLLMPDGADSGLRCEPLFLSGRFPKYVAGVRAVRNDAVCGFIFSSTAGKRAAYLPAVGELSGDLLAKIEGVDLLLFDGTFWSDDELIRVSSAGETASQMGHIPIERSLCILKDIHAQRKMLIHINNTNPILNESSPQFQAVRAAGWEVAEDGWRVDL